ncbi:MAG: TIGR00730 family Rossman fold protein [Verrucomicrobiae bacterium]|nr:TIGR00730 family Rossman fold protein [Verrucomicrobiae bacterium]
MDNSIQIDKNEAIRQKIHDLIQMAGGGHHPDIVVDVIINALKMLHDVENRGDARVIQTALREFRYSFKTFAPYEDKRKIVVFGSARTQPSRQIYQLAVEFGRLAAKDGFMVITGAGAGIMQAAHEGAGTEMSFGVNIRLPWEQSPNPVIQHDKKLMTFKYFFTRKLTFIRHADAVVLFPGGFGTMDEGFEALTLMQTGKSRLKPLILIDQPGGDFWHCWDCYVKQRLLKDGYVSSEDLSFYRITNNPAQAVQWISEFYKNYHSSRFVDELLVIRLQKHLTDEQIIILNEEFKDINAEGKIEKINSTPEETEDNDFVGLPRIAFKFDRKNYGRLRQMIERINSF